MRGKTIGKFLAILLTATMVVGVSVSCSNEKSTTGKKQTETTEKSDKKADKKKTDVTGKKEVKNDKLKNDKESDTKSDQKVENVKVETNKDNNENKSDKNDNDSKKNNSNKNDSNKNDKPSTPSKSDNNGNTNNKPSKPDNGGQTEKPQHKHSYSASVTKQPTCSSTGTRTYTCSCGDSYTESIPAVDHHWQHHDATGHYDKVVDQPAWDEPIYETRAVCGGCGAQFKTADEAVEHIMMDFGDACQNYHTEDVQTGTIHHEATYKDVWVQDSLLMMNVQTVEQENKYNEVRGYELHIF